MTPACVARTGELWLQRARGFSFLAAADVATCFAWPPSRAFKDIRRGELGHFYAHIFFLLLQRMARRTGTTRRALRWLLTC